MHVLVTHDSVLFIVLLHLHANVENEVSYLVDRQLFDGIAKYIVEFDQHCSQNSFVRVSNSVRLVSCQLSNLFSGQPRFSDNGAHSDVGVNQIDSSVASRVKHFLKRKDVI